MTSAYAALASLMNTITMEQTPRRPPLPPPITLDGGLIEALQERANFLVEFLEEGWKVAEDLEDWIADVAYAAEDAIESCAVDQQVHGGCTSQGEKGVDHLRQALGEIMQQMDSIKHEMMQIKEKSGIKDEHGGNSGSIDSSSAPFGEKSEIEDLNLRSSMGAGSSSTLQGANGKMVGFEDEKVQVMEELTGWNTSRRVVSIVGMGGVGKTTLARNIFHDERIMQHFDVCAWITVSQEYNVKEILAGVLSVVEKNDEEILKFRDEDLGDEVHKRLCWRRYLIVLDDLWTIDVWDKVQLFFPDNDNGSRIMVTTRLSNLAKQLSSCSRTMKCLDEDNSWNLLCERVFGLNSCPLELEDFGKRIAQNCKGLPLAIIVIGGLLAKHNKTIKFWKHVAKLSTPAVYLDNDEQCLNILVLSYNHLPIHLKPCFLYMGVFPEDCEIRVSKLINLWIAEGFIKSFRGKRLEEIAKEYLMDLIERNLVMIHERGISANINSCSIHDLLRELCLREAQKEKFMYVVAPHSLGVPPSMKRQRRILIRENTLKSGEYPQIIDSLLSASHFRSLIVYYVEELLRVLKNPFFRMLRVLFVIDQPYLDKNGAYGCLSEVLRNLVNLRYLTFTSYWNCDGTLAYSIGLMRNLQMLDVRNFVFPIDAFEFWNLPRLHQVKFNGNFLQPPFGEQVHHDYIVLQSLWALKGLVNQRFDEVILKTISNIKNMKVYYALTLKDYKGWSHYGFRNLGRLQQLESLSLSIIPLSAEDRNDLVDNLTFPHSLKKLSLFRSRLRWEDMSMIGSLPYLEMLKLHYDSFIGPEWNPVEGEFVRLKILYMDSTDQLINWNADSAHFPCLEQLVLLRLTKLKEISLDIGEIATLRLIQLVRCPDSVVISAKNILDDQQSFGNDELVVKVGQYEEQII